MYGGFCRAAKKSGRNDEVTVRRGFTVYANSFNFYLLENDRRSVETSFFIRDFYCVMFYKTLTYNKQILPRFFYSLRKAKDF